MELHLSCTNPSKLNIFQCMSKIFFMEIWRYLWNLTQNIFPIYWKILLYTRVEISKVLTFNSLQVLFIAQIKVIEVIEKQVISKRKHMSVFLIITVNADGLVPLGHVQDQWWPGLHPNYDWDLHLTDHSVQSFIYMAPRKWNNVLVLIPYARWVLSKYFVE